MFVDGNAEEASTMPRTGELILIGISVSMFIILMLSQTIWTMGHDNPAPLHNAQVVLGDTYGLIPANLPLLQWIQYKERAPIWGCGIRTQKNGGCWDSRLNLENLQWKITLYTSTGGKWRVAVILTIQYQDYIRIRCGIMSHRQIKYRPASDLLFKPCRFSAAPRL